MPCFPWHNTAAFRFHGPGQGIRHGGSGTRRFQESPGCDPQRGPQLVKVTAYPLVLMGSSEEKANTRCPAETWPGPTSSLCINIIQSFDLKTDPLERRVLTGVAGLSSGGRDPNSPQKGTVLRASAFK